MVITTKFIDGYNKKDKIMNEMFDLLIEYSVATQEDLELMTCLDGYDVDAFNDVIYAITDYPLIEQIQGEIVEV